MASRVQSVLLDRSSFKTIGSAKKYLKEHGFIAKKVDITDHYYRFRQKAPNRRYRYRTITAKPGKMKLVIVFPKNSKRKPLKSRRSSRDSSWE